MNWYVAVLKQYVGFSGRARRTEFWTFALINVVVVAALEFLDLMLGTGGVHGAQDESGLGASANLGLLSSVFTLAVLLPSLAVAVRRLHDTDRSGWWLLIGLVPFLGAITLLVFSVLPGTRGPNRHGADPRAVAAYPS